MFSLCCEPQLLKLDIFAFSKMQIRYEKKSVGFFLDLEGITLFIEERKRSEVGYILAVDCIALCKNCHLADYLTARLINEIF